MVDLGAVVVILVDNYILHNLAVVDNLVVVEILDHLILEILVVQVVRQVLVLLDLLEVEVHLH